MTKEEYFNEWLSLAEMDLNSAEYLQNMRPLPLEIICFHCQQAAEKILKGFLVLQNVRPPKTHNLIELRRMCESYNADFIEIEKQCIILNEYSVAPRYPKEREITEIDVKTAVRYTKEILDFLKLFFPEKIINNTKKETLE